MQFVNLLKIKKRCIANVDKYTTESLHIEETIYYNWLTSNKCVFMMMGLYMWYVPCLQQTIPFVYIHITHHDLKSANSFYIALGPYITR